MLCCCMKLLFCCKAAEFDMLTGNSSCITCQLFNGSEADQVGAAHGMIFAHVGAPACKKVCIVHGHVP